MPAGQTNDPGICPRTRATSPGATATMNSPGGGGLHILTKVGVGVGVGVVWLRATSCSANC